MVLSPRERMLLGLLAAVLALAAVYWATTFVDGYEERLRARIDTSAAQLRHIRAARAETAKLSQAPRVPTLRQPLLAFLEQLAKKRGLSDRLQLNGVPQERGKNLDAVEVKLDALTLEEVLDLVYEIENSGVLIGIDQIEITSSFRSKELIRLSLRVLAQR